MRKGLTQTLMAVAVVMMAAQAMAMAPTIGDIPSPVVGDGVGVTDSNLFVYPDAFDLTQFGHDRETPQNQLRWTYEVVGEDPPNNTYSINGATPLTAAEATAGDLPTTPTLGGRSDLVIAGPGAVNSDTGKPMDNTPNTITIRNKHLSPVGGPYTDPGTTGIIPAETKSVVFYVTDLNQSVNSNPVFFYTSDDTNSYLSGTLHHQTDVDFHTTDGTFLFAGGSGDYASSYDPSTGICMFAGLTGAPGVEFGHNNVAEWDSPFGILQLEKNSVYRIRCSISGDMTGQAQSGQRTPLWDLQVINFLYSPSTSSFKGFFAYAGDSYYFDNVGGANATWTMNPDGSTVAGTKTYDYWFTPPAVVTTQWNDTRAAAVDITGPGIWAENPDGTLVSGDNKDACVVWRILDVESNPGVNAEQAQGTLCMNTLSIDRFDLNDLHPVQTGLYSPPMTINTSANTTTGALRFEGSLATCQVTTTTNSITLRAIGTGQGARVNNDPATEGNMIALVNPGDYVPKNVFSSTDVLRDYPILMQPQAIYQIQYELSSSDPANPCDVFWVGADMLTNERIDLSYTTNSAYHHGMPNTTPQMYMAFFASNFGTRETDPFKNPDWWQVFRPRFMMGNAVGFNTNEPGNAPITITKIKVDQVDFLTQP